MKQEIGGRARTKTQAWAAHLEPTQNTRRDTRPQGSIASQASLGRHEGPTRVGPAGHVEHCTGRQPGPGQCRPAHQEAASFPPPLQTLVWCQHHLPVTPTFLKGFGILCMSVSVSHRPPLWMNLTSNRMAFSPLQPPCSTASSMTLETLLFLKSQRLLGS